MSNGFKMVDISAQVFGKYQHCTMARDGLWYADSDFTHGGGVGSPKRGALPAPQQDTPELTVKAVQMHEEAARRATAQALRIQLRPWYKRWYKRWFKWLR